MPRHKPEPKQTVTESAALKQFAQNLNAIRAWYRASSSPGREVGHVVMNELILANVGAALEMALRGEEWKAPAHNP